MVRGSFIFLMCATILVSCKSDEDRNNPDVEILNIEWESGTYFAQDTLNVLAGEQIVISSRLTDDQELSSFKVELDAFVLEPIHENETAWSLRNVIPVSGTSQDIQTTLTAPDEADGLFSFDMNLIDKQGNSADPFELVIQFENLDFPRVQIDSLNGAASSGTIPLTVGQTFVIKGIATDDSAIEELSLNWLFGNVIVTSNQYQVDTNSLDLEDFEFTAAQDLSGEVSFYLSFRDGDQNIKKCFFVAEISE